ncbi:MAG: hypothetical protein ABI389_06230 [Rhodanobacter sp.]
MASINGAGMESLRIFVAKLKAVSKALEAVLELGPKPPMRQIQSFSTHDVGSYFCSAQNELINLRALMPQMFEDFPNIQTDGAVEMEAKPGESKPSKPVQPQPSVAAVPRGRAHN